MNATTKTYAAKFQTGPNWPADVQIVQALASNEGYAKAKMHKMVEKGMMVEFWQVGETWDECGNLRIR